MRRGSGLRALSLGLLVAVLGLAAITARAVSDGEEHMRLSDAAFNRGDLLESMLQARGAAVMYAPGAPHVARAYARMVAIAVGAEAAGQRRTAQAAWRGVRGAALETRHVWQPHPAELARANENLARLARAGADPSDEGDPKQALDRARQELRRDDVPGTSWLIALVAGFFATMIGLLTVGVRGVTPDGELSLGRAKLGIAMAVLGAVCWTAAVWRA